MNEITARELQARLARGDAPVLVDVREPWEFELAHLPGSRLVPLGELPARHGELDRGAETVVICHLGVRSLQAIAYLRRLGFERLVNLAGGIDAFSRVDPSVPTY